MSNVKNINGDKPRVQILTVVFNEVAGVGPATNEDEVFFNEQTFEASGFNISSHWVSITSTDGTSVCYPYERIREIRQQYKD